MLKKCAISEIFRKFFKARLLLELLIIDIAISLIKYVRWTGKIRFTQSLYVISY